MIKNKKIKVGIIGGAGYTAGELLRILTYHPHVNIDFVHSDSNQGKPIKNVHRDFYLIDEKRVFDHMLNPEVDVAFLCVGHNQSKSVLKNVIFSNTTKLIDLSQDHRNSSENPEFVYGLADVYPNEIKQATKIANPGCFATAIQLGVMPFCQYVQDDVHVTAITGSTGAGAKLSDTSHFSWRANNLSVYKSFEHQHMNEICRGLGLNRNQLQFVPMRGAFTRGILASIYFKSSLNGIEARNLAQAFYHKVEFVKVSEEESGPDLKSVVNTNYCLLSVKKYGDYLHIISVIDNLIKGAVGQAVQNMNLMFGFDISCGLTLKPIAF
ncbi:N-acetyl-gamma-glutamyl-phosphate reductase [Fastidiosibacter lacustris]|uniref:N-acetyl-gamma-glutamyl-phosphate reductase n=1 Tax=Fastidiosibacter lacustris TaxID=2056695 RepID=UPI000E34721A|nr:N-acetyl-gamma-glutamyl-phosphate reductase [Fastidiosibacter lacustris]